MRAQALGCLLVSGLLWLCGAGGCMFMCPPASPAAVTESGEVELLDYATCRRLGVEAQEVSRDRDGRLSVTVHWTNRRQQSYMAAIRVTFQDEKGLRERGSYRWDLQRFPLGECTLRWLSYTSEAVRYRIEIKEAG